MGRNFRQLLWDKRAERFIHHSWTQEEREVYVHHHQAVNLEVDTQSDLPHSAVTYGNQRIDSSRNGKTLSYKDGSVAGEWHFSSI